MYALLLVCAVSLLSGYYRSPEERHPRTLQSSSATAVYLLPSPPLKSSATFFLPTTLTFSNHQNTLTTPQPHLNLFQSAIINITWVPFPPAKILCLRRNGSLFTIDKSVEAPLGGRRRVISIKINVLTEPHSSCHFQFFCFRAVGWNVNVEDPLTRGRIRNDLKHLDRQEIDWIFSWK